MASFDAQRPFAFLIHGFTDFYPGKFLQINGTAWMRHLITKWANNSINACTVDWGHLSYESFNYFLVSQVNTVRVANYLTRLLLRLEKLGIDLAKVKLAGHSLGAQIAGKVGGKLRKRGKMLGSIYGNAVERSLAKPVVTQFDHTILDRSRSSWTVLHLSMRH